MFEQFEMAPPDPILGLSEAFKNDSNPKKINLGVGVYKDTNGVTPVLSSVKKAEQKILADESTKAYMPIPGDPVYGKLVQEMLFGSDSHIISDARAHTAHTPGGTGALRVAGDFLSKMITGTTLWHSDPTWANHQGVFTAAGLKLDKYPYYDAESKSIAFDGMLSTIKSVSKGDVILLHGCCHNPSGKDLNLDQWKQVAEAIKEAGAIPLVDFAYQGFGTGLEEDAAGLRVLVDVLPEIIICSSFSKNFGLYRDRVGAVTFVAGNADAAAKTFSHVKKTIRTNYSNPPAHGASIVKEILSDTSLTKEWKEELKVMRERINGMRSLFVETLKGKGVSQDFSFINDQNGMFSFSGLNKDQVEKLKNDFSIYIVGSGRINVAGMTEGNMDYLCEGISKVL